MRSSAVALIALLGVFWADGSALAQRGRRFGDWEAARNGWLFSLEAGKRRARETGKPLLVVLRCQP